ncbi:hypothetical protein KI387_006644, partial [Taxus chinensis]
NHRKMSIEIEEAEDRAVNSEETSEQMTADMSRILSNFDNRFSLRKTIRPGRNFLGKWEEKFGCCRDIDKQMGHTDHK